MSADAWRKCPVCLVRDEEQRRSVQRAADAAYGKVPRDEWMSLHHAAQKESKKESEETLREDYEIFTDEKGQFYVQYDCSCAKCGFSHTFKHEEQLRVEEPRHA